MNIIQTVAEPTKLYLAWQAPDKMKDRFRWAVGEISQGASGLSFRYLRAGDEFSASNQGRSFEQIRALGYEGYPAFNLKRAEYHDVAHVFLRRLPPRARPDFKTYVEQFRLTTALAISDIALLAQTEAKLPSDGFSVVDPLNPAVSRCELMLEIAGYRYYASKLSGVPTVGMEVEIAAEPGNTHDQNAVQFLVDGQKIGNVNRLQASTFLFWLQSRVLRAGIERMNGNADRPRAFVFVSVRPASAQLAA